MRDRSSALPLLAAGLQAALLGIGCALLQVPTVPAVSWVCVMAVWAAGETHAREPLDGADEGDLASWVGVASLLGLLGLAMADAGSLPMSWLGTVGCATLLLAGAGLRVRALRALGRAFRAKPHTAGAPVEEGPYAWVRHPAELGLMACALGSAVCLGSLWAVVGALAVMPWVSDWRVRREEAAMLHGADTQYGPYMTRVARWGL